MSIESKINEFLEMQGFKRVKNFVGNIYLTPWGLMKLGHLLEKNRYYLEKVDSVEIDLVGISNDNMETDKTVDSE
jgi:hypothetical protein